jgi:hypothetical protein
MEGEAFWMTVSGLAERFRNPTAEGVVGVVEVVTFDGQTFIPAVAQRIAPWVLFEVGPDDAREIVILREDDVRRVHMRWVDATESTRAPIGFQIGVGHADLMTTARTYTHVLGDEAELDYAALL